VVSEKGMLGFVMHFSRRMPSALLLFSCAIPAQTPQPLSNGDRPVTAFLAYDDPIKGVSFSYPDSWLLNQGGSAYIPPLILQKPSYDPIESQFRPDGYVALEGRDAKQGPYRNTNFLSGWFLYRVVSGVDKEQCYRKADFADDPSRRKDELKSDWVTIAGIRFRHGGVTGEEALCNQSSQDVYATLHQNKCYLFEKQINTMCEQHGDNGIRDITPKEMAEINRAFDAVMQSVRLEDIPTPADDPVAPPRF
jgi:hypothetical protein